MTEIVKENTNSIPEASHTSETEPSRSDAAALGQNIFDSSLVSRAVSKAR